jgi:hypothetical protein
MILDTTLDISAGDIASAETALSFVSARRMGPMPKSAQSAAAT